MCVAWFQNKPKHCRANAWFVGGRATIVMASYIEPRAGVQISHYTLIDRLASGGKGEVWVARDESLGRTVAIKLLLVDNERDRKRLVIEAQAAAALRIMPILRKFLIMVKTRHSWPCNISPVSPLMWPRQIVFAVSVMQP